VGFWVFFLVPFPVATELLKGGASVTEGNFSCCNTVSRRLAEKRSLSSIVQGVCGQTHLKKSTDFFWGRVKKGKQRKDGIRGCVR